MQFNLKFLFSVKGKKQNNNGEHDQKLSIKSNEQGINQPGYQTRKKQQCSVACPKNLVWSKYSKDLKFYKWTKIPTFIFIFYF